MTKSTTILSASIAASALLLPVSSQGSIELGPGFAVIGQFDGGYRFVDPTEEGSQHQQTFSSNEFQLDFDYIHTDSGLFAHVELEARTSDQTDNQFRAEAAFIGRNFAEGVGFKVGKFISPSGYEGAEAWDRFTRTTAFGGIFAYLQNGVAGYYRSGIFNVYGAVVDGAWSADNDFTDPSAEIQFGVTTEAFVSRLTIALEKYNADDNLDGIPDHPPQDRSMINVWGQYSLGALVLAAEYNLLADMNQVLSPAATAWDGEAAMLFAKYSFNEHWKLGLRYSQAEYEDREGQTVSDSSELTLTPRYQILDGAVEWDFRADFRWQDGDNEIAGVYDGFLFELGTTLRF
ncbi:outer membrane beta-barrel protein [Ketobacter sp. MCCC 1A13808]|uniref:outer membrane beta-barrel protein n=1 Tax=Ketobacter sp. MCCC 1A13808 TaxID=2602738 RepID=UPI000F1AA794|nr:outer membrane beta-barrel protein [Ketobacter sp. MCCC 1A13808]MVF11965.1 outer membrane beta-barrel protein [Ketobacter sp. MCCC 1A13808]RLP52910.1 MAG: hypothetical protein D6160_18635 [Ketobacter sp.]